MDLLNDVLDAFYYSIIKKIDIKLFDKKIIMELAIIENGLEYSHIVEFDGCNSFLAIEKQGNNSNFDISKCEYCELTSIILEKISITTEEEWLKHFSLDYNIAIEIWDSALLIQTNTVVIDGQEYLLESFINI